ncbi:tetratricopeptide repeat protein 8 isoform 1-T3 [Glossina fuscipes fuscipes]
MLTATTTTMAVAGNTNTNATALKRNLSGSIVDNDHLVNNNNDDAAANDDYDDDTQTPAIAATTITNANTILVEKSLATLELQYFKAVSLYRRRNYEKCVKVCNVMLQAGHENNVQMFNTPPDADEYETVEDLQIKRTTTPAVTNATNNTGGGGGGGGGYSKGLISNNSSNRYSSNLQRIAVRQRQCQHRGEQRVQRSNNVANASVSISNTTVVTSSANSCAVDSMPTWMMEGVWQLKMRALTQRVYVDDLETNETDNPVNEEIEFERIATAARPNTSINQAFVPRPSSSLLRAAQSAKIDLNENVGMKANTAGEQTRNMTTNLTTRPLSGMIRPGSRCLSQSGTSFDSRPSSRCGSASRIRATSAAAFFVGDNTSVLYQASRLNPTIYAERKVLVKALFQFLYYHESDVPKAYSLAEAVMESMHKRKNGSSISIRSLMNCDEWWWQQQMGRCLLAMHYTRKAETHLHHSLNLFPHPDTYLLLSRVYQRLKQPQRAMDLIQKAVDRHPFDISFRLEQGRLLDYMGKQEEGVQMYRLISRLNPINVEALACIALNYFYDNNPEMALMYYRRILSLGIHSAELYCNIALCCLYGGQIDLVLPCFQRALASAETADQKADIWYNLSFVAITTGDFHLAKRCLKLCLTSDAQNGAALNNLAVLTAQMGDILKAKSYLTAAKESLHNSQEIENNLKYMEEHYKL